MSKKKQAAKKVAKKKKPLAKAPVVKSVSVGKPVVEAAEPIVKESPGAIILPIMPVVERMIAEWTGNSQKCGCGKDAEAGLWYCKSCMTRTTENFNVLCRTLSATHRGAGGAAICICGAGCGGSPSCSALSMLQVAVTTKDPLIRYSIAQAVGWAHKMDAPVQFDVKSIKGIKPMKFRKAKDYDVYYGHTEFGNFYYTIQDNRGLDDAMKKSEAERTKRELKNFTWWCNSFYHTPEFQGADTLEQAIEMCHVDLLNRIKSSLV